MSWSLKDCTAELWLRYGANRGGLGVGIEGFHCSNCVHAVDVFSGKRSRFSSSGELLSVCHYSCKTP